jgi:hypothetical protein
MTANTRCPQNLLRHAYCACAGAYCLTNPIQDWCVCVLFNDSLPTSEVIWNKIIGWLWMMSWKKVFTAYFKVWYSCVDCGRRGEASEMSIPWQRFELGTSRLQVRHIMLIQGKVGIAFWGTIYSDLLLTVTEARRVLFNRNHLNLCLTEKQQ